VIQTCFAGACLPKDKLKKEDYVYPALNLSYQFGVFISRSSLRLFRFPWVQILTLIQMDFFILWFCQVFFYWMGFPVLVPVMLCVGLCGGCSYVNVFDLIMNHPELSAREREMGASWNAFFMTFGIVNATLFGWICEQTFLKGKT
jgi:battenin